MNVDLSILRRLNALELESYAGKEPLITQEDLELREQLYQLPTKLTLVQPSPEYPLELKRIVTTYAEQDRHEKFIRMREKIMRDLMEKTSTPSNLLTVLFGGIYVGEPEDFRNYILNSQSELLYPVQGFGQKVANIEFIQSIARKT